MTFRLFLSHSTPVQARARLGEIAHGVEEASGGAIKMLYDGEQIASGDDWRRRISYLLHACHGAVVLLDRTALASPWVLAESTVLSIRATWDDHFRLVPLSLMPRAELKPLLEEAAWRPVALPARHFADGTDPATIGTTIAGAFAENLARRPGKSPMERLAHVIAEPLKKAPAGILLELADELGDEVPYDNRDEVFRAALVLARQMIMDSSLEQARATLGRLGGDFVQDYAAGILRHLRPLPIDPDGAAVLRSRPEAGGHEHAWLQTSQAPTTVPMYVDRAWLGVEPPPVVRLMGRHASFRTAREELIEECRKQLWARSIKENGGLLLDPDLLLAGFEMYVSMPPVDAEVFRLLRAAYPDIVFILHHESDDRTAPLAGVRRVMPPLEPARENAMYRDQIRAMSRL